MINKRLKNALLKSRTSSKDIKCSLGAAVLSLFCITLITAASFVKINIGDIFHNTGLPVFFNFDYVPQAPAVIFTGALLGRAFGMLSVLMYVLLGLTPWAPVFAFGGGASYIFQYTFGYIAAFIFAAYYTAKELRQGGSFFHIILAVLYGVFIIHTAGALYMTAAALLNHEDWFYIYDLVFYNSLSKIIYDFIFSIAAVIAARLCRKFLWIIV